MHGGKINPGGATSLPRAKFQNVCIDILSDPAGANDNPTLIFRGSSNFRAMGIFTRAFFLSRKVVCVLFVEPEPVILCMTAV